MPISKISFVRSTVLAILIGLAALLGIVGFNLWLVGQARTYSEILSLARQQRSSSIELRGLLDDVETGQRGYLLTGNPDYLEPYENEVSRIPGQLERVRQLTEGEAAMRAPVTRLMVVVPLKLEELRHTIDLFKAGNAAEALAIVKSNRGRELMEEVRRQLAAMIAEAQRKVGAAVEDQRASIDALKWVSIVGGLVILLVVGGSVWMVLLYTSQLIAAQREVQALNAGLEERVRERTADLGRANEEIQRFAYIVTHDLRAPLVNIMGFTSELEASLNAIQKYVGETSEESSEQPAVQDARAAALEDLPEAIGFIRSSTRKMDGLINAILKLSREGRRMLRPEPIEMRPLLDAAAANVQHQVMDAGGTIAISGHAPVMSDRLALEQVVGNLFDNAVKYRDPSRPLEIRVSVRQARGDRVLIDVADNGRGIAAQDHERVFDLFRRSGSQDQPGEGIGLAHVRAMVRNLGGDITLESELGKGTTMKINLPRDLRGVLAAQNKGVA